MSVVSVQIHKAKQPRPIRSAAKQRPIAAAQEANTEEEEIFYNADQEIVAEPRYRYRQTSKAGELLQFECEQENQNNMQNYSWERFESEDACKRVIEHRNKVEQMIALYTKEQEELENVLHELQLKTGLNSAKTAKDPNFTQDVFDEFNKYRTVINNLGDRLKRLENKLNTTLQDFAIELSDMSEHIKPNTYAVALPQEVAKLNADLLLFTVQRDALTNTVDNMHDQIKALKTDLIASNTLNEKLKGFVKDIDKRLNVLEGNVSIFGTPENYKFDK